MAILNYVQLSEIKTYLGITDTSEDTILAMFLEQSYFLINNYLGIETLNQTTKTDTIEVIYNDGTFWTKEYPVTELLTVNGTSYTGVLGTDYQILHNRQINVKDISNYLIGLNFNNVVVTYTAGYNRDETGITPGPNDTLPKDIQLAQMFIVASMRSNASSSGVGHIVEEKTGDYTIKYASSGNSNSIKQVGIIPGSAVGLLNKYKIVYSYPKI